MSIAWQDVVNIAPELSTVPLNTQTAILAAVAHHIDYDVWGEFGDLGSAYLAAHLASIRNDEGLVTSESLGAMARSYVFPPGIEGSLALSTFGAEYLRLLNIAVAVPVFVP